MPLTRYQIRNEYSLADPELYRLPNKNDPDALLNGLTMAGLVGLLRQLGDLSEFATDLFHNLHEELMATAGRSHGMVNRLHQVEADIPSVEKAFLSHTSDKNLLYNAGIDWHPNLRMDQNMITQGDLPRFIMDSYEECRGPPRLFLLDKFDVAGAGACSERYSDPSFFKTDFTSSEKTKISSHREKKAREIKMRASLCKNGEADIVPISNSRLHQLFLEENNQTENIVPIHHVKLKRRQSNCSVLDPTTEKSYMQRFLDTSSPEIKAVYENSLSPLLLTMEPDTSPELVPETHEICTRSPERKLGKIEETLRTSQLVGPGFLEEEDEKNYEKGTEQDSIFNPSHSPSDNHVNSGESHVIGDSGEDKLGITEIMAQKHLNGPDPKKELVVASSDFNNEQCDTLSGQPSTSKLLNNANDPLLVDISHDCYNLSYNFNSSSWLREPDQQLGSKDPPQNHLSDISEVTKSAASNSPPELKAPLDQCLENKADILDVWYLHEDEDIEESSNPFCQPSDPKFSPLPTSHMSERSKVSEAIYEQPLDSAPSTAALDFSQPDCSALQANMEETASLPLLDPKQWKIGTHQDGSHTSEGEGVHASFHHYTQLSPPATDQKGQHGSLDSGIESFSPGLNIKGVQQQPWNSLPLQVREDEKSVNISSAMKGQIVQSCDSVTQLTTTKDGKPEHGDLNLNTNGGMTWQWHSSPVAPDVEDRKPNEVVAKRIPLPRNPLVEEFVSRDKIMLRKVEERVLPQLRPNVCGGNSLLEQIRTKSLNLKPAVAARPRIKGPNTNLKVVAILEKANAIRQALAGSDNEIDEEDSWSDS